MSHDDERGDGGSLPPSWPIRLPSRAPDNDRADGDDPSRLGASAAPPTLPPAVTPSSQAPPAGPRMYWGRIEAPVAWSPGDAPTTIASDRLSGNGAVEGGPPERTAAAALPRTAPAASPRPSQVLAGVLGGIVAALVGAVAWGLVTKITGYELRGVAVAVGLIAGLGVTLAARARGGAIQVVAAAAAVIAILLGKYLAFAVVVRDDLELQLARNLGLFASEVTDAFRDQIGDVFTLFDALWFALGVLAALFVTAGGVETTHPDGTARHRHPLDRFTGGLPGALRVTVDWTVTIVGAVGIVLLVKAFVVNPYRIPSSSMEPTLHCAFGAAGCQARFSDRVLANRFIYHFRDPRRGEIIVFETPDAARLRCGAGGTFVKRLIGLPGETIEVKLIKGDGYVFINGQQLDEPYIEPERRQISTAHGPTTIPAGHYFMMGDNREQSCDSREWGTVPRGNLIGNVFATYWPPQRISFH